jgi:hypothetical protein
MTEVPDKQTEGSGVGRTGRTTRGRGRGRATEDEPAAATTSRGRGRRAAAASTNGSGSRSAEGPTALPGERLSKIAGGLSEAELASAEVFTLDDLGESGAGPGTEPADADGGAESREDGARRRRRRGGRGRGRGRGTEETGAMTARDRSPAGASFEPEPEDDEDEEQPIAQPRRSTPFGSVWDSQLGTTAAPAASLEPLGDDEDLEEPEIPEYLIAEQRRGGRGRGPAGRGAPRGGRSAYQSAIERERYGRGRSGGINRYPDVSGRGVRDRGGRTFDRSEPRPRDAGRPTGSAEPWSEVPPELEAMLRQQVGQRPPTRPTEVRPGRSTEPADDAPPVEALEAPATGDADAVDAAAEAPEATAEAPKRRTRSTAAKGRAPSASSNDAEAAPKRRSTRSKAAAGGDADGSDTPAPRRRTTRKAGTSAAGDATAESPEASADDTTAGTAGTDEPAAPKRRTTRRTSTKPSS